MCSEIGARIFNLRREVTLQNDPSFQNPVHSAQDIVTLRSFSL